MKAQVLLVFLLCATCVVAHFKPGGNFCDAEKERHDTCKPLVSPDCDTCSNSKDSSSSSKSVGGSSEGGKSSPKSEESNEASGSGSGSGCNWSVSTVEPGNGSSSGSGSGSQEESGSGVSSGSGNDSGEWEEGEYCFLLQVFLNYSITIEVIEIRQIFIQWINITQLTIVANKELTEYEMLVQIWYSLEVLFETHVEIEVAIKYLYIGEWGYICDLEGLAIDIQSENTEITIEEVIKIDITTGTCPLLIALEECGQNGTSSEQAAIQILIQKLTVIIKSQYTFSKTLVLIYQEFASFFIQYPSIKVLIFNGQIEGFGIIQSYFDICTVYWRIENFSIAVGGSVSDCQLLQVLIELYGNTSYSVSERSDFKQLEVKIQNYFEIEVDVQLRIQYFSEQLYQFFILKEWSLSVLYSLEIKGYGSCYQLIYAYVYCINHGINPGDFTVSTTKATTPLITTTLLTTKPTTTLLTTTPTTTTTPAPTTTKPNGNCGTVTSVNVVSGNITKLLSSIDADQQVAGKWTSNEINTFLGYKKKIYNVSINTTITATQKFTTIKQTLLTFAGSTTTVYQKVQAVFIVSWGTVAQYCGCSA